MVALISTIVGTFVGVVAGYYGGWLDNLLMRFTDLFLSIPFLVGAICRQPAAADAGLGPHDHGSGAERAGGDLRHRRSSSGCRSRAIIRGLVLSLKEKEFVEAARAAGASDFRIMFRHLVPNCTGQIIINTTLAVAAAILTESALSFLGFGVNPIFHTHVGQPVE